MVTIEKFNNSEYLISLSPNSSLTGINRIIFLSSITLVCGGIGIIFYYFGAALILPFAGLEMMVLFTAFYLSFRRSSKKEKIYISQDIVKVERGINKAEYSWKEFRTFAYFNIKKERDKSIRLSFRSKGKDIFIGDFLNEEDKEILKEEIKEIKVIIENLNLRTF